MRRHKLPKNHPLRKSFIDGYIEPKEKRKEKNK